MLSSQEQNNIKISDDKILKSFSTPFFKKINISSTKKKNLETKLEKTNLKNSIITSIKSIGKDNTSQKSSLKRSTNFEKNISYHSLNKSSHKHIKNNIQNSNLAHLQNKINSSHTQLENISSALADIKPMIKLLLEKTPFIPNQRKSKQLDNLLINYFCKKDSTLNQLSQVINTVNKLSFELKESNILQKYYLHNLMKSQMNHNESENNINWNNNQISDFNNSQISKNYQSINSDNQSLFQKKIINEPLTSKIISNSETKGSLINTLVNRKRCFTDSNMLTYTKPLSQQSSDIMFDHSKKGSKQSFDSNNIFKQKSILTRNVYLNNSAQTSRKNEIKNSFSTKNNSKIKLNKKNKSKIKLNEINIYNSCEKSKLKKNIKRSDKSIPSTISSNSQKSIISDNYYSVERKNDESIYEEYKRNISDQNSNLNKIVKTKYLNKKSFAKLIPKQESIILNIQNQHDNDHSNFPIEVLENKIVNLNNNNLYETNNAPSNYKLNQMKIQKFRRNDMMKMKVPFNSEKSNQIFQINKFIYSPQNVKSDQHFPNFMNYNSNFQLLSNSHQLNQQTVYKTEIKNDYEQNRNQLRASYDNIHNKINNNLNKNKQSNMQ